MELPDSDLVHRIWSRVRDLRHVHGVPEEAMSNLARESWRDKAFHAGRGRRFRAVWRRGVDATRLRAYQLIRYAAKGWGGRQMVNCIWIGPYVASPDKPPSSARSPSADDLFGKIDTRDLTKARQGCLSGPSAVARWTVRPVNSFRVIPAS